MKKLSAASAIRLRIVLLIALCVPSAGALEAAHVSAARLLPKTTLVYVQVASVPELVEAFQQTNMGRMLADPQIRPFAQGLFDAANGALTMLRDETGLTLEEMARIPQGEIAVAVVPGNDGSLAPMMIVDCGESIADARKAIAKLRQLGEERGQPITEETVDGTKLFARGGRLVFFERDDAVVFCRSREVALDLLAYWNEGHNDNLADNPKFGAIMSRCRGTKDETPQIIFYADPINYAWQVTSGNPAAQIGLAILPALGVDGFKGVGGSMVFATEDFDSIFHIHALLDSPRFGVLDLIALPGGDDTPPAWVPSDVAAYTSLHWNLDRTYSKGTKLGDSFQGDGVTARTINERFQGFIGADFEHDLLPALSGRALHITWFQRPVKVGIGELNLLAFHVRDPKTMAATLNKMETHFADRVEKKRHAGVTYFRRAGEPGPDSTRPSPGFALMDDWLLVFDRPAILEHVLSRRDDIANNLASSLEYKLIANKIARQPGGARPGMLKFDRPEESMKYMYDLAASEQTRSMLRDRSAANPFFAALNQGLEKNALPPWSAISRYLSPGGTMVTDDESGIHYMGFSLRRK